MAWRQVAFISASMIGVALLCTVCAVVFGARPDGWPLDLAFFLLPPVSMAVTYRHKDLGRTLTVAAIWGIFILGYFAGDYMLPAPLVFVTLFGCLLFAQQYAVAWGAMFIAVISGYTIYNYGPVIPSGVAYGEKAAINLATLAMILYPATVTLGGPNAKPGKQKSSTVKREKAA